MGNIFYIILHPRTTLSNSISNLMKKGIHNYEISVTTKIRESTLNDIRRASKETGIPIVRLISKAWGHYKKIIK